MNAPFGLHDAISLTFILTMTNLTPDKSIKHALRLIAFSPHLDSLQQILEKSSK